MNFINFTNLINLISFIICLTNYIFSTQFFSSIYNFTEISMQSIINKKMPQNLTLRHSKEISFLKEKQNRFTDQQTLQQKLTQARQINEKLAKLFQSLKNNTHIKTLEHSNSGSMMLNKETVHLKKTVEKLQMQVQHMKHLENVLLSDNKKLKEDVNNRRKQRVIYSNIFKKFEKDIRIWEDKYKESLLDSLATHDAQRKIREKIFKIKRKLQKQIKLFEQIKSQKQAQITMSALQMTKCKNDNKKQPSSLKKTYQGSQSYKKLTSQKQLELKTKQMEIQYQKQSKVIIYEALAEQLLSIADTKDLAKAIQLFKTIDQKTEQIYQKYEELEKQCKEKQSYIHNLQQMINSKQNVSVSGTSKSIPNKKCQEIGLLENTLKIQKDKVMKLQNALSLKLDINCRKLSTQQIRPFIERVILSRNEKIKQEQQNLNKINQKSPRAVCLAKVNNHGSQNVNKYSKNNLQKKFEQIQKQKSIDSYLLSYNEISKSMLKHYTVANNSKRELNK